MLKLSSLSNRRCDISLQLNISILTWLIKIIRLKLHKIIGRIEFTNRGNAFFILF